MIKVSKFPIEAGLYRLKEDVVNPRGDKRVRHSFWQRSVWKAGAVFIVENRSDSDDSTHQAIRPAEWYETLLFIGRNDDILSVLVPNLQPEPKSLASILLAAREHDHRINPEDVLEQLLQDKTVTLKQIEGAIVAAREREARGT